MLQRKTYKHEAIINAQIDEIKKLKQELADARALAEDLLPYVKDYIGYGLGLGEKPENHEEDECLDCVWHKKAIEWKERFDSGEIAVILGSRAKL